LIKTTYNPINTSIHNCIHKRTLIATKLTQNLKRDCYTRRQTAQSGIKRQTAQSGIKRQTAQSGIKRQTAVKYQTSDQINAKSKKGLLY
jgi:hypothetical protein